MININLELVEVQHLLNLLGNMPTHTGAYPVAVKIKEQAEAQIPKEEAPQEE
jgi:hypothetical protein